MKRILIVDDEKWICSVLQDYLEEIGYDVEVASDIASARQFLDNKDWPNLLIMDVQLPDGNGKVYVKELKHRKEAQATPIILLSADDPDMSEDDDVQSPLTNYITKPFHLEDLKNTIEMLLKKPA